MKADVELRGPRPEDLPWIYSSWIRSWTGTDAFRRTCQSCGARTGPDRTWACQATHTLATALMKRDGTQVIVACNPKDMDQMLGYVVAEPERRVLHWIYVKHPFRRLGIGRNLVLAAFGGVGKGFGVLKVTHWTPHAEKVKDAWVLEPDSRALR